MEVLWHLKNKMSGMARVGLDGDGVGVFLPQLNTLTAYVKQT